MQIDIKKVVDKFLNWKLPEDFNPDAGISFKPEYNIEYMAKQGKPPMKHEPVGTNLFDADQAKQMFEYVLSDYISQPVEAGVSDDCERKLIIEIYKSGAILFENLQEFNQIELLGVIEAAKNTVDVLYKTKVCEMIADIQKDKKASKSR